jgi:hypothetical protein
MQDEKKAVAPSVSKELLDCGNRLADAVGNIRRMLYGLSLDLRQAQIAQRAIDEAVACERARREVAI